LERAKREVIDLIEMLEGDRIGLIAFAGTSFVQCPLTLDYGACKMFLDYIDTDLIPVPGTAIAEAIRTSLKSFNKRERKSKALILITDGEDHEGEPIDAAKEAKKEGIKIFTIGVGREGGAPIPLKDGSGGFKKDRKGDMVITHLDEITLQKIALETGGSYVRSVTGDMDLDKIYQEGIKQHVEQKQLKSTRKRRWEERFQWFIFFALLFVSVEFFVSERRAVLS
jgi:Ca-activated chloride channel family protein